MAEVVGSSTGDEPPAPASDDFRPIGPDPIGKKKNKYKFEDPPGIGTWLYSFAKKCLACVLIYAFGYFGISVGWLIGPIILLVVRDQWREQHDAKRATAQAVASGDEREIILARLGDSLPSWVVFPDVERAEWLNMIVKQLWPRINHYMFDLLHKSIQETLQKTLEANYKLGSFKFEKIILGDTPVRIRGVKVYDEQKTDRNEIIMDMEVMYAGDCDVRFSITKVGTKIRAGLKDLQLHGTLRLVMKPLINKLPLIGGVQYFFLNPPFLDFNLVGIADVLDMPGLADLIRRIVQEQIAAMCVLPKKMFLQLAEDVNPREICAPIPQGVIRVCAIEARNLMKLDVGVLKKGKSDPYVVLAVGDQSFKSKTIMNTVTPRWDFHCEMMVEEIGQNLLVTLYDFDTGQDEFLGRKSVDLSVVRREGTMDIWLDLEDVKKGAIHLKLTWFGLSGRSSDLQAALLESQNLGLASCMLTVHLDSAKNLPLVKEGSSSRPDPYAILSVGKMQLESAILEKTSDPVFEKTFNFLVCNPQTDTLLVKLMDKKSNTELGSMKQPLDLVFGRPGMILEKQNFTLNSRSEAKVVLDMQIKVLKYGFQGSDDEDDEINLPGDAPTIDEEGRMSPGAGSVSQTFGGGDWESTSSVRRRAPLVMQPSINEEIGTKDGEGRPILATVPSVDDGDNNMRIRLTIRYSQPTNQLIVVVHSVANLPFGKEELPDPYVKLYILPERKKKHKTEAFKDQCNPLYDAKFDFQISDLKGKTLEVTVCNRKNFRSSPKIGDVQIALDEFVAGNSVTNWYPLVD